MASGRMEFHADTIMQHANFSFVLPNDVEMEEVFDQRHYDRPTKTLILLHGLTGTDTDWLFGGVAQEMAIQFNLAVFMPTAGNNFYLDRGYRGGNWGSYVGEEFPAYIRKVFGCAESREDTFIGGLSMGGYGALHTALAFPETFSGCIALSSALRIHHFAAGSNDGIMPTAMLENVFGDLAALETSDKNPEVQVQRLKKAGGPLPKLYLACGTEDGLIEANREFDAFLTKEGVAHTFEAGPGKHNWTFWNQYLPRGLEAILG